MALANNLMRKEHGITLIELAIGLIVLGLIITPIIAAYSIYIKQQKIVVTEGNILAVQSALQKFVEKNGYYPKPATPNITFGNPSFGLEITPNLGCATNIGNVCFTSSARDTDVDPDNAFDRVLIGAVPHGALGLPVKLTLDGYGRKFTYAVTQYLTNPALFREDIGVIRIIDGQFPPQERAGTNMDVHYVVVSHGENGRGAHNLNGRLVAPCMPPGPATKESENCNNNYQFTDNFDFMTTSATIDAGGNITPEILYTRKQSLVDGGNYYDDYLAFTTNTATDLWSSAPANNAGLTNIFARAPGNVQIGPGTAPIAKVHVSGDVQATSVQTKRICPIAAQLPATPFGGCEMPGSIGGLNNPDLEPNIFNPADIGGTPSNAGVPGGGVLCGGRRVMTALVKGDEICTNSSLALPSNIQIGNCPQGQYARGTDGNGQIVCAPP